jgi:hypothetical protein
MTSKQRTLATDDTLQQLWAVKDDTARRFRTVAAYFAHLNAQLKTLPKTQTSSRAIAGRVAKVARKRAASTAAATAR